MPTKKSTTKKTTKRTAKAARTTKTTKTTKPVKAAKNRCKSIVLFGIILIVLGVLAFGGVAIYYAISRYQATNAHISDFTLITEEDRYNTIAMDSSHLEVIVSDWGNPATERQIKVNLETGKTQAIVHYGRSDINNCAELETNCIEDEVYYGELDQTTLTQVTNSARAILGDEAKMTFGLSEYAFNDALVELCQTVIKDLREN